jgi:hypothetical protein
MAGQRSEPSLHRFPANGNTFLSFSTDSSSVASDVGDDGGPFAKSLAQEIVRKDLYHEQIFYNVSLAVMQATNWKQKPRYFDGFRSGRFYFVEKPAPMDLDELTLWNDVVSANSVEENRKFIQRYPASSRVREAVVRMQEREETIAWNLAESGGQRDQRRLNRDQHGVVGPESQRDHAAHNSPVEAYPTSLVGLRHDLHDEGRIRRPAAR